MAGGRLPTDAEPAELIVGFLDGERAGGVEWPAEEFNEKAADYYAAHGLENPPRLDEESLACIRATARELRKRWDAVPDDGTLELTFERDERPN